MICKKCGAPLPQGMTVCPYCGAEFAGQQQMNNIGDETIYVGGASNGAFQDDATVFVGKQPGYSAPAPVNAPPAPAPERHAVPPVAAPVPSPAPASVKARPAAFAPQIPKKPVKSKLAESDSKKVRRARKQKDGKKNNLVNIILLGVLVVLIVLILVTK